jgi:hypothetical protein
MYGSGNTKPIIEKAGKNARVRDDFATADKADASTPSQDTATLSSSNTSARPQAQRDASTASIKSGVLGNGSEEPRLQQETVMKSQPPDSLRDPITYPTHPESENQSWHGEPRVDSGPAHTRGGDTTAIGQTSTYRSYPLATGEKTSPFMDREPSEPTRHQQPEQIGAPAGREGARLEVEPPHADSLGTRHVEENARGPDRSYRGAAGIAERESTLVGPEDSTLTQQHTKKESDNPYSASRLDPRVDPHANTSDTGGAPAVTEAFTTSAKEPADRLGGAYGSSVDSRGLSGAKSTAEHSDGPQEMSQSLQAKSVVQPSGLSQETSRSPKEEDLCENLVSHMPGAFNYGSIVAVSSYHEPVPKDKASYYDFGTSLAGPSTQKPTQDHEDNIGASDNQNPPSRPLQGEIQANSPLSFAHQEKAAETRDFEPSPQSEGSRHGVGKFQSALSTGEPPKAATGGVEKSDTFFPEDSHKGRNSGFLGAAAAALGLGGHAIKKHTEDKAERPAAAPRRESIPTTTYPPGTALGDRPYPKADVGGPTAASSRSLDTVSAPSTGAPSQPSATKSSSGTGPVDRPYSRMSEEHLPAAGSGAQASNITSYTGASSQPGTMKYVTNLEQTAGSMRDAVPSTPNSSGTGMAEESHAGRNTAIGGAAVAGGGVLGAHEFSKHQAEKLTTGTSASNTAERPDDRNFGRDAVIGSTPTAATGGRENSRHHAEQPSTGTPASTAVERPGNRQFGRDAPIGGMAVAGSIAHDDDRHQPDKPMPDDHHMSRNMAVGGPEVIGASAVGTHEHSHYQTERPFTGEPRTQAREKPKDSHLGRNAAIGGAAAVGAVGVGAQAYSLGQTEREGQENLEAEKARQKVIEESRKAAEKEQRAHEKALAKDEKKAEQAREKALHKEEKKAEKEQEKAAKKEEKEHEKVTLKEEKKAEKEHEKVIKKEEKEEKEHEKVMLKEEKKAEKEHEKAIKKEEKEHEKAVRKEEKEHEREHMMAVKMEEKKEMEREKELAKQERQEEKRSISEEKDKKKHGLLGIFHRKRDSQDNEAEPGEQDPNSTVKTTGGTEAVDAAATASQEREKRHILGLPHHEVKNKLHKDPPPGLYSGESTTPAHADHPIQQTDSPNAHTATAEHNALPTPEPNRNQPVTAISADTSAPATGPSTHPTHHDASSAAKNADLPPQGYASQAYATDTSPSPASSRDITLHSDGRRYYADGRPVDENAAELDGSAATSQHQQQGQGSEAGAGRKVLEKLHLRKASR